MNQPGQTADTMPGDEPAGRARTIVVGYDGSAAASDAVHWALREARPGDAVVVAAIGDGRHRVGHLAAGSAPARSLLEALWLNAPDVLDTEPELVVVDGEPARALCDLADDRGADLVVVGRHRGGMHVDHTAQILRHSARPVVVIP